MTWTIAENSLIGQAIADTSTVQKHALGSIIRAKDPTYGQGEFIYLKGVASTAVGSWVGYSPAAGTSVLAVANGTYPLAVAMAACDTTTKFGWYQIRGQAQAKGLTSITHTSGFLALTGTAGSLDDASVIGDHVFNARKTVAVHVVGTFIDTYEIDRPFSTNIVTVRN